MSDIAAFLVEYLSDDLPKRTLDTIVFGGVAAGAWSLVTGRAKRLELTAFLKTHSQYISRLKRVVEFVKSRGDPDTFKNEIRRDLNETYEQLRGQQLVLYALLGPADRKYLMEYFERIEAVTKTFDFSITSKVRQGGALNYDRSDKFLRNIAQLFKPNVALGAAVETPLEQACIKLRSIVWHVFLLPVLKTNKVELATAKSIDQGLKDIRAEMGKSSMSVESRDWILRDDTDAGTGANLSD